MQSKSNVDMGKKNRADYVRITEMDLKFKTSFDFNFCLYQFNLKIKNWNKSKNLS